MSKIDEYSYCEINQNKRNLPEFDKKNQANRPMPKVTLNGTVYGMPTIISVLLKDVCACQRSFHSIQKSSCDLVIS